MQQNPLCAGRTCSQFSLQVAMEPIMATSKKEKAVFERTRVEFIARDAS